MILKRPKWIVIGLILVLVVCYAVYKVCTPTKNVDLATFNTKEDQLTKEAVQIHDEIQSDYDQLEKGKIQATVFKTDMVPLFNKMKTNWDQYNQFTQSNQLSQSDRNSKAFQDGVQLASNIRLDEYTFLINVTQYNLSKQQIETKYKDNLNQFDEKLQTYEKVTRGLDLSKN